MMQKPEDMTSRATEPAGRGVFSNAIRGLRSRLESVQLLKRDRRQAQARQPASSTLKIARYGLVLMDQDGQVVWSNEWDSGGVFEFRPRQRLWICCAFTNHSGRETEVSEYEVELVGEDGSIVQRFNDSFGDSLVISPGEQRQFPAEWRL
jgi:hypothetical protein